MKNQILVFTNDWCAQCFSIKNVIKNYINSTQAKNIFIIDADKDAELFKKYKIMHTPSVLFFKNGKVVDQVNGFIDEDQFTKFVNYYY